MYTKNRKSKAGLVVGASLIALSAAQAQVPFDPFADGTITPEDYYSQREMHVSLMRGLPSDPALRQAAIRDMERRRAARGPLVITPSWRAIGPAPIPNGQTLPTNPVSGRVTAIEIDPTDANVVYVGTANGGVYRTTTGGATWTPIFDGARTSAIGALALAPSNNAILYVGTGEANLTDDSYAGIGLYRIDNVTTSPTLVGPINPVRNYIDNNGDPQSVPVFNGRAISRILVHPTDPATVFVATTGAFIGIGGDAPFGGTIPPLGLRGLYRSTNATAVAGTVSFSRVKVSTSPGCFDTPCTGNRNVDDMVFDPANPNNLIVWQFGTNAAGDGGVWRSTNALAADPAAITFVQTFATTASSFVGGRGALVVYQQGSNPAVLYAASGEPSTGTSCRLSRAGALRVSSDGGVTWSSKLSGGGGFCGPQCFYDIGLAVLPGPTTALNDDVLLIGGTTDDGLCGKMAAKSIDGGATFTSFSRGLHSDAHAIKIAPSASDIVYRGDDGGIWKSTDGGLTWSSLNNSSFSASQFEGIAVHPTDREFTLGGTQDNGTNLLDSSGLWRRVDFGDGGYSAIDQNALNTSTVTMYHTYFNLTGGLIGYASVPNVASAFDGNWSFSGCLGRPGNGITCRDSVLFYAPLVLGPGLPNPVYFGTDRLYRSANGGTFNTVVSQAPITGSAISTIAISPQDDNYRLVGLLDGGLFYTTTGSSTLIPLDPVGAGSLMPDQYIARVIFDPANKNTAYITLSAYMGGTAPSQSHVWKVSNLGTSPVITPINGIPGPLPDVPVNSFAVDPFSGDILYAGTDIGVYVSINGGDTWTPYGAGMPVVPIFGMAIQNSARILRVATHGRGMYEIPLVTPQEATQILIDIVNDLVSQGALNQGNGNSLVSKLQAAIHQLNAGNSDAASGQINAFINEVNALLSSGRLSLSQGQALIAGANSALTLIIGH